MSDGRASNGTNDRLRKPGLDGYRDIVTRLPGFRADAPKRNVIVLIVYVQLLLVTVTLVYLYLGPSQ